MNFEKNTPENSKEELSFEDKLKLLYGYSDAVRERNDFLGLPGSEESDLIHDPATRILNEDKINFYEDKVEEARKKMKEGISNKDKFIRELRENSKDKIAEILERVDL